MSFNEVAEIFMLFANHKKKDSFESQVFVFSLLYKLKDDILEEFSHHINIIIATSRTLLSRK